MVEGEDHLCAAPVWTPHSQAPHPTHRPTSYPIPPLPVIIAPPPTACRQRGEAANVQAHPRRRLAQGLRRGHVQQRRGGRVRHALSGCVRSPRRAAGAGLCWCWAPDAGAGLLVPRCAAGGSGDAWAAPWQAQRTPCAAPRPPPSAPAAHPFSTSHTHPTCCPTLTRRRGLHLARHEGAHGGQVQRKRRQQAAVSKGSVGACG